MAVPDSLYADGASEPMADDAIHDEPDGNRPPRRRDAPGTPTALLLFPMHAAPPEHWYGPWVKTGWSISVCGDAVELGDALEGSGEMALVASPWPGNGEVGSAAALADELQHVITALGVLRETAPEAAVVHGGMMRRSDFLNQLSAVMRAPDEDACCALLAVRVDGFAELGSRLDRTAIFDLEESIAERFAGELHKDDAYTIWLEFGFGVLVQRETSEQVQALVQRICARVADEPFVVAGEFSDLTVSIGVALPPRGNAGVAADRWFATAHAAQAIAFRHGGNQYDGLLTRVYDPIPAERVLIIREWVQEAKTGKNVLIEFQPVLPLKSGATELYSVHAKLRDYRDPLGGVYRREYLRLAREAGAMVIIDRVALFGAFQALEQERTRGGATRLMVPVELETIDGMPWRWLEAELRRRRHLVNGLVLELQGDDRLFAPECVEHMLRLRAFGVGLAVSDRSGGLERVQAWSRLPLDLLRLQAPVVEAVPADVFRRTLALWRDQGRQVIVDAVEKASDMAGFKGLDVDYLRGQGLAAIGPRLDYDFA
jgi:EAL domain-containing protein (putative c-di-GMP-specific phosphodiesterase class I)/GGDEF domain-containing protein